MYFVLFGYTFVLLGHLLTLLPYQLSKQIDYSFPASRAVLCQDNDVPGFSVPCRAKISRASVSVPCQDIHGKNPALALTADGKFPCLFGIFQ